MEAVLGEAAAKPVRTAGAGVARATAHPEPSRGVHRPKLRPVSALLGVLRQVSARVVLVGPEPAGLVKHRMSAEIRIRAAMVVQGSAVPSLGPRASTLAVAEGDPSQREPSRPVAVVLEATAAKSQVRRPIRAMVRPIPDPVAVEVDRGRLLR